MTGPTHSSLLFWTSWSLAVVHTVLYFTYIAPYLWAAFSPVLPVISAVLNSLGYATALIASYSDPGVLPRRALCEAGAVSTEDLALLTAGTGPRCSTCDIIRPARSHHCSTCDNCVELYDHHCGYINNCIGALNYKYFMVFLATCMCMSLWDFIGLVLYLCYQVGVGEV
jgi:palmitoyltransferase ZDHHC9/14/18